MRYLFLALMALFVAALIHTQAPADGMTCFGPNGTVTDCGDLLPGEVAR